MRAKQTQRGAPLNRRNRRNRRNQSDQSNQSSVHAGARGFFDSSRSRNFTPGVSVGWPFSIRGA